MALPVEDVKGPEELPPLGGVAVIPKSSHSGRIAENFESHQRVLALLEEENMAGIREIDWGIHSTTASEEDKASAERITW